MNTIASRLAYVREQIAHGISYEDFASRLNEEIGYEVAQPTVIGYLKGSTTKVPGDFLAAVAKTYGVSVAWLVAGEGAIHPADESIQEAWYDLSQEVMRSALPDDRVIAGLVAAADYFKASEREAYYVALDRLEEPRHMTLGETKAALEAALDAIEVYVDSSRDEDSDIPFPTLDFIALLNAVEYLDSIPEYGGLAIPASEFRRARERRELTSPTSAPSLSDEEVARLTRESEEGPPAPGTTDVEEGGEDEKRAV